MSKASQIFLKMGDEYLAQYFLTAHNKFRGKLILSRLFTMGHVLELYAKAVLSTKPEKLNFTHNVPDLLKSIDSELLLSDEEIKVGKKLFSKNLKNFDMNIWVKHTEALELYQALYYLKDLKYYLDKTNEIIYPVTTSISPINKKFLGIVKRLRNLTGIDLSKQNDELESLLDELSFKVNPINQIIE